MVSGQAGCKASGPLKMARLLVVCAMLCLCGCATTGQPLYQGPAQPDSGVVTVKIGSWPMFMQIFIDGKWVPLHSGSTVLPGTYKISCLCNCRISDSVGPSSQLEAAGLPHFGQAEFPDTFTATAGDTVTFFWSPGMRVLDSEKAKLMGQTWYCAAYGYTVTRTKVQR